MERLCRNDQGDSASGSFEYTYWSRDKNGTHVWDEATNQFIAAPVKLSVDGTYKPDGTHTQVNETYDYADVQNPTLYIHVDLEYKSPILRFMTPQSFQRVSGAEVFISNNSANPD